MIVTVSPSFMGFELSDGMLWPCALTAITRNCTSSPVVPGTSACKPLKGFALTFSHVELPTRLRSIKYPEIGDAPSSAGAVQRSNARPSSMFSTVGFPGWEGTSVESEEKNETLKIYERRKNKKERDCTHHASLWPLPIHQSKVCLDQPRSRLGHGIHNVQLEARTNCYENKLW